MSLPIDRTAKSTLDNNLVNGNTSDAPAVKNSNDTVYNTIDELYNYTSGLIAGGTLQPYPFALNRQAIINGNFDIWQRGTSWANPVSGAYTADRWFVEYDGSGATRTVSQQAFVIGQIEVPNEPKNFLRCNVSAIGTGNTTNYISQKIESVRTFAGKKATLSFYAKADVARSLTILVQQRFGTGGTPSSMVTAGSVILNVTANWTKYTVTVTLPSISGKTLGTNGDDCITIYLQMPGGVVMTYDFAQVQVNAGDQALPFQPKSFGDELQLCQRYYEKSYSYDVAPLTASNSAGIESKVVPSNTIAILQPYGKVSYKVPKRTVPTVTVYPFTTPANTGRVSANSGSDLGVNSGFIQYSGTTGFNVHNNSGATATTTDSAVLFHWASDSEI